MKKIFSRTGVEVFDLGNGEVVKSGSVEQITKEYLAYRRLYHVLGRQPSNALGTVTGFNIEGNTATLRLLDVRAEGFNDTLEQIIEGAGEDIDTLKRINRALNKSLKLLCGPWSEHLGTWETPASAELLIQELLGSLIFLWQRAKPEQKKLIDIGAWLNCLTNPKVIGRLLESDGKSIQLGACHRDFCTCNIWLDSQENIRVLDPQWSITGSAVSSTGHLVLDLASLRINLERLQSDRDRQGYKTSLDTMKLQTCVDIQVDKCIAERQFRRELYELSLLRRYFSFAVCSCEHCSTPKRIHRFELMQQRVREYGKKLLNEIGGYSG